MIKAALIFYLLAMAHPLIAEEAWKHYTSIADSLDSKYAFEEALKYRMKALEAAENQDEATTLTLTALKEFTEAEKRFRSTRGPNPEAYTRMQEAVNLLKVQNAPHSRLAQAYYLLSQRAFDYMYLAEDADAHLNRAFEYIESNKQPDTLLLVEMMQFSGFINIVSELKKFKEAIEISEKGLQLLDELKERGITDDDLRAKLLYNLSLVHGLRFLNIPQKELQYTLQSQQVLLQAEKLDIEPLILSYRRLASFERTYGNYEKAKNYLHEARRLYSEHKEELRTLTGFKLELALHRLNLAVLIDTRNEPEILETVEEVAKLARENELDEVEKGGYKDVLNFATVYYLDINPQIEKAKHYNQRALAIHLDSKKAPYSLDSYNQTTWTNRVNILFQEKNYDRAFATIKQIQGDANYVPEGTLLYLKTKTLLALGKLKEAKHATNELIHAIAKENSNFQFPHSKTQDYVPSYNISDANLLTDVAEAFQIYYGTYHTEVEQLYWLAQAQMQSNLENTPLNKDLKRTFDRITAGLMSAADQRTFTVEESNRLLTFMEVLASQDLINNFLLKREIAGNTNLYKLVEEEQYIRAYITYLKKELQGSADERIKQELFEKDLELSKNREQLRKQFPQLNLYNTPSVDITNEQHRNVIKFKAVKNDLFKIRLNKGELSYTKIPNYHVLKSSIADFLRMIPDINVPIEQIKEQGKKIYENLFDDDFESSTHTVIIPDDILHYLPFDVLVRDDAYLIETQTLSYAPSFYFLDPKLAHAKAPKSKRIALFAPEYAGISDDPKLAVRGEPYSLSGAKAEVEEIARLVSGKKYIGNSATKSQFKAIESDIGVLHLAMHSMLNEEDPELSNLVFSTSEADYEMYIAELYGMNFNGDLAVLSACNTGIGGFKDGGNLVSMQYAFMTAGIPATVASLWNAPDQSTRELMVDFYHHLKEGTSKSLALQRAKLTYLKNAGDENLRHPFYWAGFVLSGDDAPIALDSKGLWEGATRKWVLAGLGVVLVGILLIRRRRNRTR